MKNFYGKPVVTPTFGGSQWREPVLLCSVSGIFFTAKSLAASFNSSLGEKTRI
jgi:hypothetical protein